MGRRKLRATGTWLAVGLAVAATGCENFLDVNENPNNPETVRMSLMLPGMLMAFGHDVLGLTDNRYGNLWGPTGWGPEWLQQYSHNQDRHTYAQTQWYEVANLDANILWGSSYQDVMQEAKNIMAIAGETEQWEYHGIAKFIFAWNAAILTDAYGSIPFSEAFDTQNRTPGYDTQQQVYAAVFQLIDEAISEMQRSGIAPVGVGDVVYGGDMAAWVRLARTVQGRLHMRLVYAPGESATEHAQAALAALGQGIRSPSDAPTVEYVGGPGARQPWYRFTETDEVAVQRNRSSRFFIEMLRANADPRLPIMADPADLECPETELYQRANCVLATRVIYRGNRSGGPGEPDSAISMIGEFFRADDADYVWVTYEDATFLEAEAELIVSGAASADAPYRQGIRAHMERLGVAPADIAAYLAAKPPLSSVANPLEEIITEKYIANFLRDEVWHDWRRTGYPDVPLVVPPAGERLFLSAIPQRVRTPASEIQFNSESVAAAGIDPSLEGMLQEVWWASGSPSF